MHGLNANVRIYALRSLKGFNNCALICATGPILHACRTQCVPGPLSALWEGSVYEARENDTPRFLLIVSVFIFWRHGSNIVWRLPPSSPRSVNNLVYSCFGFVGCMEY